ncbi:DgyrCDS14722 [Dimorphilus gyrociliatus]|uniref:DgyrCDS14722 n=1 Tax=Dimorphilus gyrociliatus TaxID=2664684 RepID=A0A7I8WEY0_9ANNE|nr:DgyrCDS14722 [Dimorphilus gyrociliatus]
MKIFVVSLFVLFAIYQAHASGLISDLAENQIPDAETESIDLNEREIDEELENELAKRGVMKWITKLFSSKKGISKAQCGLCAVAPATKRCQRVKKLCLMKHKIIIPYRKV